MEETHCAAAGEAADNSVGEAAATATAAAPGTEAATAAAPTACAAFNVKGLVPLLSDSLWCLSLAAAVPAPPIDLSLFDACLVAPGEVSVHCKQQIQPLLPQLQQQQAQQVEGLSMQQIQQKLLRLKGCITRQQSLGRRLCFFDLQTHTTAAAAAAAAAGDSGAWNASGGAAAADPITSPPETAAAAARVAVCCSLSSSDFCGLDVHRSIFRKLRLGDFVEALGILERRGDAHELTALRQKLGGPLSGGAPVEILNEVTRRVGLKVLAIRACRPAAAAAAAAAEAAAAAAAAAAENAQRSRLLLTTPQAAGPPHDAAAAAPTEAAGAAGGAAVADLSKVCKFYLVAGTCRRLNCPLLHVRDGRLRRQFDVLKAQRQVLRVQQQMELLPPLSQSVSLREPRVESFSALTLQLVHPPSASPKQQQQQQQQRVYPRSLRGRIFADWLVATYGVDRLRQGSGVVEIAGGRGELAFELAVKHNIPTTIIDPRCTYTPNSLAVQPPAAHIEWERPLQGKTHEGLFGDTHNGGTHNGDTHTGDTQEDHGLHEGPCGVFSLPQQARSSAMNSGSKRAAVCPLRLTRRQANWLLRHKGLKKKEAEAFFVGSVETIPALFTKELIDNSSYVRDKLLTASAIVGLHPDEATGDIMQTGLLLEAMRRSTHNTNSSSNSSSSSNNNSGNSSSKNSGDGKFSEKRQLDVETSQQPETRVSGAVCTEQQHQQHEEQQQKGKAAPSADLAIAIVPCCVFSEKFPERRVPLAAAEAAGVSPAAAAEAASAVPIPSSVAAAEAALGIVPRASAAAAATPSLPAAAESWDLLLSEATQTSPENALHMWWPRGVAAGFMADAEADGQVLVRTYEELLLWLHLQDPKRRLQQLTLPMVGKNQVIFLPP